MPAAFDHVELLERAGNDMGFLSETVEMLASDGRALMAAIRSAIRAGDAAALGRSAHALKGMISNFCAPAAQESALGMERHGKSGDLAAAAQAADALAGQVESLIAELQQFVGAS